MKSPGTANELTITLEDGEVTMLDWLAKAKGLPRAALVRGLIRREYDAKSGGWDEATIEDNAPVTTPKR
jgi:hypothetical protein